MTADEELAAELDNAPDARLAEVIDRLAGSDSPVQLTMRATLLKRLASRQMLGPAALLAEAADTEARAAVQRDIAAALVSVDAASELVTLAEQGAAEVEAPERRAADQAVNAAHLLGRARDDLEAAADAGAEPAVLIELRGRLGDAAAVEEHERGRLATAQQASATARGRLADARQRHREAVADLAAAQAALDQPLRASLDPADRAMALMLTWPARAWFAATGEMAPLNAEEAEVIKILAGVWADEFNATPVGAAARVRNELERRLRRHGVEPHVLAAVTRDG